MQVVVPLYHHCSTPLYQQLAEGIRRLIDKGTLTADTKLPSTRELAESLDVSRCTVSQAYNELTNNGYVYSPSHAGTYVARRDNEDEKLKMKVVKHGYSRETIPEVGLSNQGLRLMSNTILKELDAELFPEINFSAPSAELLPTTKWFNSMAQVRKQIQAGKLDNNPDVFGCESLRQTICKYLASAKGINCNVEQIAIFSSAQIAVEVFASILINDRSNCVVENPGFPGIFRTVLSHNGALRPIEVDLHGLQTDRLGDMDASLAYVTPNRQTPLGVRMSESRRKQLLAWAERKKVVVIEDDFDSEYCFTGKPQVALKSEDSYDNVVYLSSFWAMMYPLTKLGFAVIPEKLIEPVRRAKAAVDRHANIVEEEALAQFISDGSFHRHLRRTKPIIAENRNNLISKFHEAFGNLISMMPSPCGTSLVIDFSHSFSHESIIEAARELNIPLVSTRSFYIYSGQFKKEVNEFIVSIACLNDEAIKQLGELKYKITASSQQAV